MLNWLRKLWARPTEPEVEYDASPSTGLTPTIAGPSTSGFQTTAPLEKPASEEPDGQP